jgi:Acetoacetate decarboxylase (ADC)
MLKGFTVPLTPAGKSPLATVPPWHYSSDCVVVEYSADPAAIASLLPPDVVLDEKSGGRAFFWFLDWQFTASNDELTDPARYQYREAFALVDATFDGTPINYCPFIFVDNDAGIWRTDRVPRGVCRRSEELGPRRLSELRAGKRLHGRGAGGDSVAHPTHPNWPIAGIQAQSIEAPLGIGSERDRAPDDQIVLGIHEVPPSQAMEMGQIMPDVAGQ